MNAAAGKSALHVVPYIVVWLILSTGLIFMNAGILKAMPYPAMLTAWHMLVSSLLVRVLRVLAGEGSELFGGASRPLVDARTVGTRFAPVAGCFALALALSNRAYMYSSVAFIQMIKASHGPMTYLLSVLLGTETFMRAKLQLTSLIALGVMMSVTGELRFSVNGFLCQAVASLSESLRVALIALLLNRAGLKMPPLVALSCYAPLCLMILVPFAVLTELPEVWVTWRQDLEMKVGLSWMLLNGFVAFALNVSVVLLIQKTSAVVYILCGIGKDVMIVTMSVVLLGTPVSSQQVVGYILAIGGIQVFNQVGRRPAEFERLGVIRATLSLLKQAVVAAELADTNGKSVAGANGVAVAEGAVAARPTCNGGDAAAFPRRRLCT